MPNSYHFLQGIVLGRTHPESQYRSSVLSSSYCGQRSGRTVALSTVVTLHKELFLFLSKSQTSETISFCAEKLFTFLCAEGLYSGDTCCILAKQLVLIFCSLSPGPRSHAVIFKVTDLDIVSLSEVDRPGKD